MALVGTLSLASAGGAVERHLQVQPAASGLQVIRQSITLPDQFLREGDQLRVITGESSVESSERVLSWWPAPMGQPRFARRVLLTFPFEFKDTRPTRFTLTTGRFPEVSEFSSPSQVTIAGEQIAIDWAAGRHVDLEWIAPPRQSTEPAQREVVETSRHVLWERYRFPDPAWPRIVEVRQDSSGTVVLQLHLQRIASMDGFAPEMGWTLTGRTGSAGLTVGSGQESGPGRHPFREGEPAFCLWDHGLRIDHPVAPRKRRGEMEVSVADGMGRYRYRRCLDEDHVPMQPWSWQRAEIVLAPPGLAPLSATLQSPHMVEVLPEVTAVEKIPASRPPALLTELAALVEYHHQALVRSATVGDDFGNLTSFQHTAQHGSPFGMNRLNHNASLFTDGAKFHNRSLIETAILWCDNFHDQSIWWGEPQRGGTRYNNVVAQQQVPLTRDYMWRSNSAVHFCTKGYDSFWLAWEETGDPRFREALEAQIAYSRENVHADQGECRNVGDVRDFVTLYRGTGDRQYLDQALRLFRELRGRLSTGHLFDQGGKPLAENPPFIDDDARGLTVGYAKPYIIGYALTGLPALLEFAPDEPDLRETVRAVADFLAATVDPAGGWRYPHPRSSLTLMSFGPEHAWQLMQAAQALGPEPHWLDAIELVLRARLHGFRRTGMILSTLEGWEISTGKVADRLQLQDLYAHPEERDPTRDYDEGRIGWGSAPPEGTVYFAEVLEYYLSQRPVERLLRAPADDEPLGRVLKRAPPGN